jgi:hypothetical protein
VNSLLPPRPVPRRPPPQPWRREASSSDLWDDLVTGIWVRPTAHDTQTDLQAYPPPIAIAIEPAVVRTSRPNRPVLFLAVAAIIGGSMAAAGYLVRVGIHVTPAMMATFEAKRLDPADEPGPRDMRVTMTAQESTRVYHRKSAAYRELWRTTVWFHPLADEEFLPWHAGRKFGAKRHGHRPTECGRGHCGVDLGYFGLPVRAAREGIVKKVQRKASKKEGRYVRIEHGDGFVSYYMHLNTIRADLKEGMRVEGGEEIGEVGRTGIKRSPPHLHFALAYLDGREKIYIDPEPLLRQSSTNQDERPEDATFARPAMTPLR